MKSIENKVIEKHFWCPVCKVYWKTSEFNIVDPMDNEDDNFENYESNCPKCKEVRISCPHYYANLKKMSAKATGPRTPEGKEKVSRNPIKHGLYTSNNNIFFPAKPGKYKECKTCEQFSLCNARKIQYCTHKTEILLKFLYAYKTKDINMLKEFAGMTQAKLMIALNDMFNDIQETGMLLVAPKVNGFNEIIRDEEGNPVLNYSANPLLNHIPNFINTLGFNADQQQMTPAKSPDNNDLNNPGKAAEAGAAVMSAIFGFIQKGNEFTKKAAETREKDPVYKSLQTGEVSEDEIDIDAPEANPFN